MSPLGLRRVKKADKSYNYRTQKSFKLKKENYQY